MFKFDKLVMLVYRKDMDYSLKEGIVENFLEKIKSLIFPSVSNNYKSRFLQSNVLLSCVILLLALKIALTLVSVNLPQNLFFADVTKLALESFVNQTRHSLGLKALTENEKLNQAAKLKAEDMVQYQYFNHTSPAGVTPWSWFLKAGYNYKYAGENLAIGFYESEEVYNAWLNSPSHKANILNPNYTEVGTAVLSGFDGGNTIIVVQEFGSRLPSKTPSSAAAAKPKEDSSVKNEPAPAPKTELNNEEKVLSQTTEQNLLESPNDADNDLSSKLLNYAIYSRDDILQNVIYGVALIVIGSLLALIFFNFKTNPVESPEGRISAEPKLFNGVNFRKDLVFRAVLLLVLLSASALFNKEIIVSLIPHQIII